jgi:hypothetical protein
MTYLKYLAVVAISCFSSLIPVFAATAGAPFSVEGKYCLAGVCIGDSAIVLPEFAQDPNGQYSRVPDCHARITGLTQIVRKMPDYDLSVELRADPFNFKHGMAPANYYRVTRVLLDYAKPRSTETVLRKGKAIAQYHGLTTRSAPGTELGAAGVTASRLDGALIELQVTPFSTSMNLPLVWPEYTEAVSLQQGCTPAEVLRSAAAPI